VATVGPDIIIVLVAILGIVLIIRGPRMLPKIGEALGRTVKTAREEIPSAIKDDPAAEATGTRAADTAVGTEPPERPSVT
jgi:Sec-independent protein translocase protein TatA